MIFDLDGTPPDIGFPDTALAETDPNGLLAIGGDLSQARILDAYRHGIFPWFSPGQPILWWSPAPRMVLFPGEFHCSRSLRRSLRNRGYQVSINLAFEDVIRACAGPRRPHEGTWLLPEMIASYIALNIAGHAHSVEVWLDDDWVGGLYGIDLGHIFCGESMFSAVTNASKFAFIKLAQELERKNYSLIDCQLYTDHLASLGAIEMPRSEFIRFLKKEII